MPQPTRVGKAPALFGGGETLKNTKPSTKSAIPISKPTNSRNFARSLNENTVQNAATSAPKTKAPAKRVTAHSSGMSFKLS